jgi:two-component system, cell cycle sensor histidine kinase and response regulator CckA
VPPPRRIPLSLLLVEDEEADALLVVRELERGGYRVIWERVDTRTAMEAALDHSPFDLIISDYRLPGFLAPEALAMWKDRGLDCPFLVVSGSIGEEQAVELLRAGAADFFLKDRLSRLCSAVGRELREVDARRTLRHTERQREEALLRLRRSERLFQDLFESAPEATVIVEVDGTIRQINKQGERLFGYGREELRGGEVETLICPSAREAYRRIRKHLDERPVARLLDAEARNLLATRKDGSTFPAEIGLSPMTTESGVTIVAFQDVTDRHRLEERVRQAEKMEAIGRLAGGVAHDFNNVLGVILGHAQIMLRAIPSDHPMRSRLAEIASASNRAASLTHQLLAFSRPQAVETRVLDLNQIVSGIESMLTRLIGEDVTLTCRLGQGLGRVRSDPTQIEQVLMNLAINARDAMPQGGQLVLQTSNADLDETTAGGTRTAAGSYVCLSVADTGEGMSPEVKARVFEPFFTTKEPGRGTGLGLATVHGIVQQSEGFVSLHSELGCGTTFKIYLPRVDARAPVASAAPCLSANGSGETILLVEDEASLREILGEILETSNYRVLTAADPARAIEISRQHPDEIHLLLTDVIMPGMNGGDLARQIKADRPALRILYMSGHTNDTILQRGGHEPGTMVISKPFTQELMTRKLREALAGLG